MSAVLPGSPELRTRREQVFHELRNPRTSLPGELPTKWDFAGENGLRLSQACVATAASLVKIHCTSVKNLVREKSRKLYFLHRKL